MKRKNNERYHSCEKTREELIQLFHLQKMQWQMFKMLQAHVRQLSAGMGNKSESGMFFRISESLIRKIYAFTRNLVSRSGFSSNENSPDLSLLALEIIPRALKDKWSLLVRSKAQNIITSDNGDSIFDMVMECLNMDEMPVLVLCDINLHLTGEIITNHLERVRLVKEKTEYEIRSVFLTGCIDTDIPDITRKSDCIILKYSMKNSSTMNNWIIL